MTSSLPGTRVLAAATAAMSVLCVGTMVASNAAPVPPVPTQSTVLLPGGSTWKFDYSGKDLKTSWRASSFNDSGWKSGAAELGRGDGDEATVIGSKTYRTVYFRHAFTVTDPSVLASATLSMVVDDGAVAYLNGAEIGRHNMPTGRVSYSTAAAGAETSDGTQYVSVVVPVSRLVAGTNVIAVEVHQAGSSRSMSTDATFNANVTATLKPAPSPSPTVTVSSSPTPTPTVTASPTPSPTATPTPTVTASPSPTPTSTVAPAVIPDDFGAVGDGIADDTAALQAAFNALKAGDTLTIPTGRTYRHTAIVKVLNPGVTISGGGTILATNEATSSVWVMANNVTIDGPTFRMGTTTQRWVTFDQMKLRLGRYSGITLRNVTIDGSAAAGLYVGGTSNFTLDTVTVQNTRADAIHMTGGAAYGTLTNPRVINPGDDGVAVVSYVNDGQQVHDITVHNARVEGQVWGRGISVVGGYNITHHNPYVYRSAGACVYISAESEFNSYGVTNVAVNGGTFVECNQQAAIDAAQRPSPTKNRVVHGAVLVYNSQPSQDISNVTIRDTTITDTDMEGYDQVVVRDGNSTGGTITRQEFNSIAIKGGSRYNWKAVNVPTTSYRTINWTRDGSPLANVFGW